VPPSPIEGDKTVPSPCADLLKDSNSRNPGSTCVDLPPKEPEGRGDPNDPRVRLKRDCVALLAAFRLVDAPTRIFILGNTQLYWDPEWPDVKLAQACYLLSWLVKFKESIQSKSDSPPLLVITGDYNSLPGDQVPRYHLPALQLDCKFLSLLFDNPHI
jgi:CCR4-NOT transcription complex subunit 6